MAELPDMTVEEARAIVEAMKSDPEAREIMAEDSEIPTTESAAAAGIPYMLGGKPVPAATVGTFLALSLIDSPVLGRIDECTDMDAYRALYVACCGVAVMGPVMGYQQRCARVDGLKELAANKPEIMAVYMAQMDIIERTSWGEFDRGVLEFMAQFGNVTPAEVHKVLFPILRDAQAGLSQMAASEPQSEDAQKKTSGLMLSGWRKYKRIAGGLLGLLRWPWRGKSRLPQSGT